MKQREFMTRYEAMCSELGFDATKLQRVQQAEAWFKRFGREASRVLHSAFNDCSRVEGNIQTRDFEAAVSRARVKVTEQRERELREEYRREQEATTPEQRKRVQAAFTELVEALGRKFSLDSNEEAV